MEDAEDYVEYHIYELTPEGQPESPEALFGRLQSRRTQFLEFVQRSFVLDYIWQKDPFSLHISQPNKEGECLDISHFILTLASLPFSIQHE